MALAAQQSLLDELMGSGRNAGKGIAVRRRRFDDANVCKLMLVDFCPHDLFVNTRQDLGHCEKIHDLSLQEEYRRSSRCGKLGYEDEYERYLKALLVDVERRIKRGQERLRLTQGDPNADHDLHSPKNELINQIQHLAEKITFRVVKSEELGNACRIEEAQGVLDECEEMRREKAKLEMRLAEEHANDEMHKAMEVCSVCGSLLIVGDIQSRLDEHTSGKQHAGYAKIRASLERVIRQRAQLLEQERNHHAERPVHSSSTRGKRDRADSNDDQSSKRHRSSSDHRSSSHRR